LKLVRGQTHPRPIEFLIWGGGLLTSVIVLVLLGKIALRLLQEAQDAVQERRSQIPAAAAAPALAIAESAPSRVL